jgi:hypothetical protein
MNGESIYNLIPDPYIPPNKSTLYRSKFPGAAPANKKPSASMGQPHTVVDAAQFLKKGTSGVATVRAWIPAMPSRPHRRDVARHCITPPRVSWWMQTVQFFTL